MSETTAQQPSDGDGLPEALEAFLEEERPPKLSWLEALAPLLSERQVEQALQLITEGSIAVFPSRAERELQTRLITALLDAMPDAERIALLRRALGLLSQHVELLDARHRADLVEAARITPTEPWEESSRYWLLAQLAEQLPQDLLDELVGYGRAAADHDRFHVVSYIVPYLPEPERHAMLRRAIDRTWETCRDSSKLIELKSLLPLMPAPLVLDLLSRVQQFPSDDDLVRAIRDLLPYLPEPKRAEFLPALIEHTRSMAASPWQQRELFLALAPYVRDPRRWLEQAERTTGEGSVADAIMIARIGQYLNTPEERAATLSRAVDRAGHERGDELRRALDHAPEFQSEQGRLLLDGALSAENSEHPVDEAGGARLRALVQSLPAGQREAAVEQVMDQLFEWYGGSPPPAPPPPPPPPTFAAPQDEDEPEASPSDDGSTPGVDDAGQDPWIEVPALRTRGDRDERRARVVSTGFASPDTPAEPRRGDDPLEPGSAYLFWVEIGEPVRGSIETRPQDAPLHLLPEQPRLHVALFAIDGGFRLAPDEDVGELQVGADGGIRVARPASDPGRHIPAGVAERRLFFALRAPEREGTFRLRCNLYHEQTLIQSRLVEARVHASAVFDPESLRSTVDYTLVRTIEPAHLRSLPPHRLSVMLNHNDDGTHGFWFFGEGELKQQATLTEGEMQDLIGQARRMLRRVAWGDDEEWADGKPYRYAAGVDADTFRHDLTRLAIAGYRFHSHLVGRLAGRGPAARREFEALVARPGQIQIALKRSASHTLPAALIYDHPLDTNARPVAEYELCEAFVAALRGDEPLGDTRCFQGDCPSRGGRTTICPSGFWGYRHFIGMPISIGDGDSAPAQLRFRDDLTMLVAVSTDTAFHRREAHEQVLRALRDDLAWNRADSRASALDLLARVRPHLVYFFCHGGWDASGKIPYLEVGPRHGGAITVDNLTEHEVWWEDPRPLVFVNGCHTTAVEPAKAFQFLSGFVDQANAAGVIGTEITVFEELACDFAEECLRRFLGAPKPGENAARESIGEAVRNARLALLRRRNPLGLVYSPYALAGMQMVRQDPAGSVEPASVVPGGAFA